MRDERSNEIGASASGILLKEQSTPRHRDLNAGIWIRAVRRAPYLSCWGQALSSKSYSPPQGVGDSKVAAAGLTAKGFTAANRTPATTAIAAFVNDSNTKR